MIYFYLHSKSDKASSKVYTQNITSKHHYLTIAYFFILMMHLLMNNKERKEEYRNHVTIYKLTALTRDR